MSSKKIWQYPEATSITNDDYILMDSNTETGSQCLKANKIGAVHITKTVTERKVYKASDDNANGFSEVTVAVPYTDVHYDKDDIVSFVGEDLPLKSVTAYIEPQQDLHGYDSPWVGGAGKNLIPLTVDNLKNINTDWSGDSTTKGGITFTILKDAVGNVTGIKANGTATQTAQLYLAKNFHIEGTTYTLSGFDSSVPQNNESYIRVYAPGNTLTINHDTSTSYKDLETLDGYTIWISIASGTVVNNAIFYPQLEKGSTATTFAPYSNICPISGWSAVDVNKTGKNIATTEIYKNNYVLASDGTENYASGFIITKGIKIDSSKSYYLSMIGEQSSSSDAIRVGFYDKFLNFISRIERSTPTQITIPNNAVYIRLSYRNIAPYFKDIQLEIGDEATTYEPYNGTTITLDLDGTRYGGELDVVNGVLTVDRAYVDLGTLDWRVINNHCFYSENISDLKIIDSASVVPNLMCSHYPTKTPSNAYNGYSGDCISQGISGIIGEKKLLIYDRNYSDATAFKTAMNGHQLVYELATPLTIQLTPTQVSSLMGVNNVWADTGEIAVEWQTLYVTPTT